MPRTITQLAPGAGLWIYENGATVQYIYLGTDGSGNARVLRKYCFGPLALNSSKAPSYAGSDVDLMLENTGTGGFLSRFDADTLAALQSTDITYSDATRNGTETVEFFTVSRRAFLLSITEYGSSAFQSDPQGGEGGISYLPALKTYYGTADEHEALLHRKPDEAETPVNIWTRSARNTRYQYSIQASGYQGSSAPEGALSYWCRPALSFRPDTEVSPAEAPEVFLLPQSHRTYWVIQAETSLGASASRPVRGKLCAPNNVTGTVSFQLCNNFGDASPAWITCPNGGVVEFGAEKTADHWELGVRVNAQLLGSGETVPEPSVLAVC